MQGSSRGGDRLLLLRPLPPLRLHRCMVEGLQGGVQQACSCAWGRLGGAWPQQVAPQQCSGQYRGVSCVMVPQLLLAVPPGVPCSAAQRGAADLNLRREQRLVMHSNGRGHWHCCGPVAQCLPAAAGASAHPRPPTPTHPPTWAGAVAHCHPAPPVLRHCPHAGLGLSLQAAAAAAGAARGACTACCCCWLRCRLRASASQAADCRC